MRAAIKMVVNFFEEISEPQTKSWLRLRAHQVMAAYSSLEMTTVFSALWTTAWWTVIITVTMIRFTWNLQFLIFNILPSIFVFWLTRCRDSQCQLLGCSPIVWVFITSDRLPGTAIWRHSITSLSRRLEQILTSRRYVSYSVAGCDTAGPDVNTVTSAVATKDGSPDVTEYTSSQGLSGLLLNLLVKLGWLRSKVGGTPVLGRRNDRVLRSACSWRVTTMWVKRPL